MLDVAPERLPVRSRAARWLKEQAARSPGTFVYLFVVVITTWTLASVDQRVADVLLRQVSTNLVQMARDAPRSLFLSAFMLSDDSLSKVVALFLVVHVPVERWLGTRRWLTLAAVAHVGASAITTVGIWLMVRSGHASQDLIYPVDVGVSYALAGVAAAETFRLPRVLRPLWLAAVFVVFSPGLGAGLTFTDGGHLCAFLLGLVTMATLRPGIAAERRPEPAPWGSSLTSRVRWLATPPPLRVGRLTTWLGQRGRGHAVAAVATAAAALGFAALLHTAHDGASNQTAGSTGPVVSARVVAVDRSCGTGCPRVTIAYTVDGSTKTATIPASTPTPRVSSRVLVRTSSTGDVTDASLPPRTTVDASGFFGLGLVVSMTIALAFVVAALRRRRTHGVRDLV